MPKEDKALAVEGEAPRPLAPANYTLVGLPEGQENFHIPHLSREYTLKQLQSTPGLLELLHRQGWPHVEKSY